MNTNDLKIFEAVANYGTFTKAAEVMHTVQSNVSVRIKSLEDEFNIQLFNRTPRKLELTAAGEIFMQYSRKFNLMLDEARQELLESGKVVGTLKIGCNESGLAMMIPDIIKRYSGTYPDIDLEFKSDNSINLIQDILQYKLDFAFVFAPFTATGLRSKVVKKDQLVFVMPASSISLEERIAKQELRIVIFDQGCGYRSALESWLADQGIVNYKRIVVNTLEVIINFVEAGVGIALLPEDVVTKCYYNRNLRIQPLEGSAGTMTNVLVCRDDITVTRTVKTFMDMYF